MSEPMTASEARQAAQHVEDGYPALAMANTAKATATLLAYVDMLEREARVKVKPMVWQNVDVRWSEALTLLGSYSVRYSTGIDQWEMSTPRGLITDHRSDEAAKAAAQAHYEAAILSAIEGGG